MADGKFSLTKEEKRKIRGKIQEIESKAHTKIVIHVARNHTGPIYQAATKAFSRHRLHHETVKTGILIFISIKPRQFQILGDQHIHEKIGEEGWNKLAQILSDSFKKGQFYGGLDSVLNELKKHLETHFTRVFHG